MCKHAYKLLYATYYAIRSVWAYGYLNF